VLRVVEPRVALDEQRAVGQLGALRLHAWGYIRLSLFSTAQPLYTMFPIIFGSCFSKVTIGYNPR
jgi:hypothetical protein